jgi:hypothetical protein
MIIEVYALEGGLTLKALFSKARRRRYVGQIKIAGKSDKAHKSNCHVHGGKVIKKYIHSPIIAFAWNIFVPSPA